ncbi:MAG: DNA-directed RNA polymerase subunit beta' [Candidatus Spechtbacteria bacterium RIFCSPHIGHO2_02_FULL_43_15b]|nr:MAG: DNA-directed RNA polymerase subunit beta' [Candidatus Spechtbacteria bacterium RIFCSPHIGHO2_02_FULL_43_15b]
MAKVSDFSSIRLKIASPDDILSWSHGEVTKPETINYRTQKPEKDGLFCERIFGPEKDYECYCGKYRRIRYKGIICDKCGVEVTRSIVRRERLGHIKLAVPVAHIWFLRGIPSHIGLILDIPTQLLERVVYYASYVVISVNEEAKKEAVKQIADEFNRKVKAESKSRKQLESRKSKELDSIKSLKVGQVISEVEYFDVSLKYGECFSAGTGSETLVKLISETNLKKLKEDLEKQASEAQGANLKKVFRRLRTIRGFIESNMRPEWMFLTMLPVLPPELRPMVQLDGGRYATSDLNDLYRRVINRNNRLKRLLEINAPEVICRNEKRMLQEAVDALIDNSARKTQTVTATTGGKRLLKSLADMLKGKQGRFRQNLLGKRVDYSGRSVIVVGPTLELSQCGLPKKMALELFRPFVIQKILQKELAYNIRAAGRLIEEGRPEIWEILEEAIQGKCVLLNRAPTLHRLGIQAFQPVLIEGDAIRIHPLVCAAFNADFDGDQMAVHVPLSEEAQEEARSIMMSSINLLKPATGSPIATPTKDIVLGCYWMSRLDSEEKKNIRSFGSFDDALLAYDMEIVGLKEKIRVRMENSSANNESERKTEYIETCAGRILFSNALPKDFPFVNEELNSRTLRDITSNIYERYGSKEASETLDKVKSLGFLYATLSGISWAMGDLNVPKEKSGILEGARSKVELIRSQFNEGFLSVDERRYKIIEVWQQARQEITKLVPNYLDKDGSVSIIANSGARGSWSQIHQMTAMRGLAVNPAGQTMELPVESSFKEGLTPLEYFISTHGARKGTADTALRTATAGYLTRRLVDVAQDVVVIKEDCGDAEGLEISKQDAGMTGQSLSEKLIGRIIISSSGESVKFGKSQIIDNKLAEQIEKSDADSVTVRSPLTCKSIGGICAKCYGWDLGRNSMVRLGEAVGIVAAQAIGEPGTQLTMRTFHTGGVAGTTDITQGLPRVEEVFEARTPKGRAAISEVQGVVGSIKDEIKERLVIILADEKSSAAAIKKSKTATKKRGRKSNTDAEAGSVEYKIPKNIALLVSKGDLVSPGQQLSEGNIDLQDLYRELGKRPTERYIIESIQKIYTSQGANIHDKHIEIMVRQMFSRVRITRAGNSVYVPGEVVELADVAKENIRLKKEKKTRIEFEIVLLGVTKAALASSSFLSAASFQETSRVLIEAAVMGKEDKLEGLKENVIIGKLIPAGTGFRKQ